MNRKFAIAAVASAMMWGCLDTSSEASSEKDDAENLSSSAGADLPLQQVDEFSTLDDLPACTESRNGNTAFVKFEEMVFVCIEKKWQSQDESVLKEDDLKNCTESREGMEVYVSELGHSLVCTDGVWSDPPSKSDSDKVESSSSSKDPSSGNASTGTTNSGSSQAAESCSSEIVQSSSSMTVQSSSSVEIAKGDKSVCGDLWCGPNVEDRVHSGLEESTGGYWFVYDDNAVGGDSYLYFPIDVENDTKFNIFKEVTNAFGGVRGNVRLGSAYEYPFAGVGFNVVNDSEKGADITNWEGVCLAYSSTMPFAIELVPENERVVTEYNNYKASVSKSTAVNVIDLPWAKFKQESGWGKTVSMSEILRKVYRVNIRIAQSSGDFNIISLGRYGTCNGKTSSSVSSSSVAQSSSSVSSGVKVNSRFLWNGWEDVEGRVDTGSEEETAGYWYDYDDSLIGGKSKISYPADVEENAWGNFFGPLVEAYGGVKVTAQIDARAYEYPYVGVGFDIVSQNREGADVSAWEGFCITYSADSSFRIMLIPEDEMTTEYNDYFVNLPRSSSLVTSDIPWAKFKQESGWGKIAKQEDFLKRVAAVWLRFSLSGNFFIQSIGSYGNCTRPVAGGTP